jgi:hypothetical protein
VWLEAVNVLGETVAVLVDGEGQAGRTSMRFDAAGFPGGVYLLRLRGGTETSRHAR